MAFPLRIFPTSARILRRRSPGSARLALEELEPRLAAAVDVLTYHNDLARTGANLAETILAPSNVNSSQFGKLFSYPVDGQVYAQPLFVSDVHLPDGSVHNIAYVATEHDSVYAFDADDPSVGLIWQKTFINPKAGVTTVPAQDTGTDDITPEIGITGTPVVDRASQTLYVVAKTKEVYRHGAPHYVQRLHALDLATGAEKFGGPVLIADTKFDGTRYQYRAGPVVEGTGDGSVHGRVHFNALREHQRSALTLVNGVVYVAWASHGDNGPYHGWLIGYDAATLAQVTVFNTTPNGSEAGIWMSGGSPAVDDAGNLYLATGNGTFDSNGPSYGDSVLELPTTGGLAVADSFTPWNQDTLSRNDTDLGSGGVLLLPPQPGPHPLTLIQASKGGSIYQLDRTDLGGYQRCGPTCDDVVAETPARTVGPALDTPALFNDFVYYIGLGDTAKAFQLSDGLLLPNVVSHSTQTFGFRGATPSVSADGTTHGIVWAVRLTPSTLFAYDATNLSRMLYNSDQISSRDALGTSIKFSVPTVTDGHVYVGTDNSLVVYGLLGGAAKASGAKKNKSAIPRDAARSISGQSRPTGVVEPEMVARRDDRAEWSVAKSLSSGIGDAHPVKDTMPMEEPTTAWASHRQSIAILDMMLAERMQSLMPEMA
jgi:hypothetical protein